MAKGKRRQRLQQGRQRQPDRHDPSHVDTSKPVKGVWPWGPGRDAARMTWVPGARPKEKKD